MTRIVALVRDHSIAVYVLLAWAFSWAIWVPMALSGTIVTPGGSATHFPGLLGPLIAAIIVTGITHGREGLLDFGRRAARWRIPLRWYAWAFLPLIFFAGILGLMVVMGGSLPPIGDLAEFSGLPPLAWPIVIALVLLFNGYGEEGGWRGFLTDRLSGAHGRLSTSAFVALVWFIWHVPAYFVVETYRNLGPAIVPMMGIGLLSGAIVLTWLYLGSGRSILIVALWHLSLNLTSATSAGRGLPGAAVWLFVLLWACAVTVAWMVADEPASRPFMARLRDGFMLSLLRSPIGRRVHGMTVLTFRGRRSGRTFSTPVECVYEPGHLFILVAHADVKQWWRNVLADPNVTVEYEGRTLAGRAVVHAGPDAEAQADLATYVAHRPRAAGVVGLPAHWQSDREALVAAARRVVWIRIDLAGSQA